MCPAGKLVDRLGTLRSEVKVLESMGGKEARVPAGKMQAGGDAEKREWLGDWDGK